MYISREKSDHHYIQTLENDLNDLFSHCNLILGKLQEKVPRKARVKQMLMPPGHPIILLTSH